MGVRNYLVEGVALGRRILPDYDLADRAIRELLDAYDRTGGVEGNTKNLIFAANGPKPDIVLRDAMSNDIEIVANSEYLPRLRPADSRRRVEHGASGGLVAHT